MNWKHPCVGVILSCKATKKQLLNSNGVRIDIFSVFAKEIIDPTKWPRETEADVPDPKVKKKKKKQ